MSSNSVVDEAINCSTFGRNISNYPGELAFMYSLDPASNSTPCGQGGLGEDYPMPLTMTPTTFSFRLLEVLKFYYVPPVIGIGIAVNVLLCLVLLTPKLAKEGSSYYLVAVSLADASFLVCLLTVWINILGVDVYNRKGWCQLMSFLNSLSTFLPLWYVVLFAVDRAMVHYSLTSYRRRCSPLRAKISIIGTLIIGVVVYINSSLTMGVVDFPGFEKCIVLPRFIPYLRWFSLVDSFVNIVVPYTIILASLVITVRFVTKGRKVTASPDSDLEQQSSPPANPNCRLTKTTLWVLTAFLITRLPSESFRLIHVARIFTDDLVMAPDPTEYFYQQLAQKLLFLSYAIKPLIYLLFHEGLRAVLRRVLRRAVRRASVTTAAMAMTSASHVVSIEENTPLNERLEITPV